MSEREIERWVTMKGGRRIPIYSGESKEDVAKRIKSSYSKSADFKKSAPAKQKVDSKEASKKSKSNIWDTENTSNSRQSLKKAIDDYKIAHRDNPTAHDRKVVNEMRDKYDAMVKETMDKTKARVNARLEPERKRAEAEKKLTELKQEHYKLYKHDEDNIPDRDRRLNELENQIKELEDKKSKDMTVASERSKKMNAEAKYQDSIKQGNKITFKNGKIQFKGKDVPKFDTSDALAEIKGNERHAGKENSLSKHLDKDGNLSEERKKIHAEIMQNYFNGVIEAKKDQAPVAHQPYAPGDEHVAMFTGGGGASGKGAFSKDIGKFYSQDKNPMVVDPDALKGALLKYDDPNATMDVAKTGFYHEESSALAKQIYQAALENNYPVMYDGTATGGGIYKLLDMARKNGYKAEMNFIFSDWKTVRQNSLDRLRSTGRFVPPEAQVGAHQKAYKAVEKLQSQFDSFKLWDNAGRNLRPVGESSLGRNLRISNAESWNRFKTSYDDFLLSQEEIDRYYEEADAIEKQRRLNSYKK